MGLLRFIIWPMIFLTVLLAPYLLYAQVLSENAVKALYIVKIIKFIKFGAGNIAEPLVCILDDGAKDSVSNNLTVLSSKKALSGINFKNVKTGDINNSCNLVYISNDYSSSLKDLLIITDKHKLITLSDINGFTRKGGMFGFAINNSGNIKVELNYSNLKNTNNKVGAELLEMIKVVE